MFWRTGRAGGCTGGCSQLFDSRCSTICVPRPQMVLCLRLCCNVCCADVTLLMFISMPKHKNAYTCCYRSYSNHHLHNKLVFMCRHFQHDLQLSSFADVHHCPITVARLVYMQDCHADCMKSTTATTRRCTSSQASDSRSSPALEDLASCAVHELLCMEFEVVMRLYTQLSTLPHN